MLPPVLQDVYERVADFARRRQLAGVVAVVPHLPAAAEHPIDRLREANRQPLNSVPERGEPVAHENQVDMIALDAELNEPEFSCRGSRKRRADCGEEAIFTERRNIRARPERDVDRTAAIVRDAATVRQAPPSGRWLSPRAIASAAPSRRGRKLQLSRPLRHLE